MIAAAGMPTLPTSRRTRAFLATKYRNAHREPSSFEIVVGLLVYVTTVALLLYVVAAIGR